MWPKDVANFIVPSAPKTFFYVPDFLDPDAEKELLKSVYAAGKWKCLSHRRLQIWGGTPHSNGMIAEKIPEVRHSPTLMFFLVASQTNGSSFGLGCFWP